MDFDKKAQEILHLYRRQDMPIDVVEQNIAAALKAARNDALEEAAGVAEDIQSEFGVDFYIGIPAAIRVKKVP